MTPLRHTRLLSVTIGCASTAGVALLVLAACSGDGGVAPEACEVSAVALGNVPASLSVGQEATLTATATATNCTQSELSATWSSTNVGVVGVSQSGVVTGVAPGTATISASIQGMSSSAQVSVAAAGQNLSGTFFHDRTGPRFDPDLKGSINLVRDPSCDDVRFTCYSGTPVLDVPQGTQSEWLFGVDKSDSVVVCLGNCGVLACVGTISAVQDITADCVFINLFVGTFTASRTKR